MITSKQNIKTFSQNKFNKLYKNSYLAVSTAAVAVKAFSSAAASLLRKSFSRSSDSKASLVYPSSI